MFHLARVDDCVSDISCEWSRVRVNDQRCGELARWSVSRWDEINTSKHCVEDTRYYCTCNFDCFLWKTSKKEEEDLSPQWMGAAPAWRGERREGHILCMSPLSIRVVDNKATKMKAAGIHAFSNGIFHMKTQHMRWSCFISNRARRDACLVLSHFISLNRWEDLVSSRE